MLRTRGSYTHSGIDLLAVQVGDVDFEASVGVLGKANFVGRRTPSHIDGVRLTHHGGNGTRVGPDAVTIVGDARGVDVEPGKNLSGGMVETQNDLNRAIGVLG